jgi:hypothetical protein
VCDISKISHPIIVRAIGQENCDCIQLSFVTTAIVVTIIISGPSPIAAGTCASIHFRVRVANTTTFSAPVELVTMTCTTFVAVFSPAISWFSMCVFIPIPPFGESYYASTRAGMTRARPFNKSLIRT